MADDDRGSAVAGRTVLQLEGVGVLAIVLAVAALVTIDGPSQWYAVAALLFVAATAFGFLANAVLRR